MTCNARFFRGLHRQQTRGLGPPHPHPPFFSFFLYFCFFKFFPFLSFSPPTAFHTLRSIYWKNKINAGESDWLQPRSSKAEQTNLECFKYFCVIAVRSNKEQKKRGKICFFWARRKLLKPADRCRFCDRMNSARLLLSHRSRSRCFWQRQRFLFFCFFFSHFFLHFQKEPKKYRTSTSTKY